LEWKRLIRWALGRGSKILVFESGWIIKTRIRETHKQVDPLKRRDKKGEKGSSVVLFCAA